VIQLLVSRAVRTGWVLLLCAGVFAHAAEPSNVLPAATSDEVEAGRRIYQDGVLPSGEPLKGTRPDNVVVSGAEAACKLCHRPSGMGSVEGDIQVSPVTGNALFEIGGKVIATMDPRSGKAWNLQHDPYTDASFARALRTGQHVSGRTMNVMMPRYALSDADMKGLVAYLRQLSVQWSPGVSEDRIRFATVVAPDVAPERRKAMLDTLRTAFAQKNGATLPGRRYMTSAAEMLLRTGRRWDLDVWELHGPPETWTAQLDEFYRRAPVFALVSGISDSTWEPVDAFCQRVRVPCWFPSVDLPPGQGEGFYAVYFSRGVALEAGILARHLRGPDGTRPKRLTQVFRDEYVGRGAVLALTRALAGSGVDVRERRVEGAGTAALRRVLEGVEAGDAIMLWLRSADLKALEGIAPPAAATYFSGELVGGEVGALPAGWKSTARLVYPYELPDERRDNTENFDAWLKVRHLEKIDEPLQAEAFFATELLGDTITEMLDNLYRDYLLERVEYMLSRSEGGKAEQRSRDRAFRTGYDRRRLAFESMTGRRETAAGKPANMLDSAEPMAPTHGGIPGALPPVPVATPRDKQEGTSIYRHLSLAPGQRFASKGGYIVRFANIAGDGLVAESDWIVP
jgi:hypothetical protein